MILKKRMNSGMDALKKWMIILFTLYQTATLYQNGCSAENICSSHPCCYCKWLVWHSSTSPNQQRRPLPSLLSLSFFYVTRVALSVQMVHNPQIAEKCNFIRDISGTLFRLCPAEMYPLPLPQNSLGCHIHSLI